MGKRFFDVLARINTIILFLIGLCVLGGLGLMVFGIGAEAVNSYRDTRAEAAEGEELPNRRLRLGDFDEMQGTSYLVADLYDQYSEADYSWIPSSSGGYRRFDTFNYLFYDRGTRQVRWLVDHNDFLFAQEKYVRRGAEDDEAGRVIGLLFLVVPEDTNTDGQLTSDDRIQVAGAQPSGEGFTMLITDLDEFLGWYEQDDQTEVVLYTKDRQVYSAEINMPTGTVVETTALAELPRGVKIL